MTRPEEGTVVYVDIGGQRTEVNLFKQSRLRLTRSVETGGEHCTRAFADAARLSTAEAEALKREKGLFAFPSGSPELESAAAPIDRIILEVQRSIDYYRPDARPRDAESVIGRRRRAPARPQGARRAVLRFPRGDRRSLSPR